MIDFSPWNVTDYQEVFVAESKLLIEIFRNEIVEIHHFGSTAVKDLPDNRTLDILPVVKDLDNIDQYAKQMQRCGYRQKENHFEEHCKVFSREVDGLVCMVMMIERTDFDAIDRRIAVRDYLRRHPKVKKQYGELKMKLARQHADDYTRYKQGKDEYVALLEEDALKWYRDIHS